ncbi:MAG: hypothetical protein WC992_08260 [Acholeplasmataceae bacterium]
MAQAFVKDPDELLDYSWSWQEWMPEGDSILNFVLTYDSDLILERSSQDGDVVTAWFSGGVLDKDYEVLCQIETVDGRKAERTVTLRIRSL